jgi:four helix bundle protein
MTFQFALSVLEFCDQVRASRHFALADQLMHSGCSVGANVKEAQAAESKADFIHKMKIASKEAEEAEYWLELCNLSKNYPKPEKLLVEIEGILKVISKIVSTSRKGKTN